MSDKRTLARLDAARWKTAIKRVRDLPQADPVQHTARLMAFGISVHLKFGVLAWVSHPLWYVRDWLRTDVDALNYGEFSAWRELR